jgi:hypothetical protein
LKNSIGPKDRHPSGAVYPDVIFMKEKDDNSHLSNVAKLYQTILEYPLSKHNPETYKITNMGYWVLNQNEDYKNYYAGFNSKVRNSIRLESVSKRIKRYLDNLIRWGLVERVGEVDVDTRNGQKTFQYRHTNVGYIIAYATQYYNFYSMFHKLGESDKLQCLSMMKKIKQEIFEHAKRIFSGFNSNPTEFLVAFYTKCLEFDKIKNCPYMTFDGNKRSLWVGLFDQIVLALVYGLSKWNLHFPNGIEYLSKAHTFVLTSKECADAALKLYFMALDEFPSKKRKMFVAHEKAQIESELVISQPSKDWEEAWLENRTKDETLVLYSVCQNKDCKTRCHPVLMPYELYRHKLVTSEIIKYNDGFPPMRYILDDCPICRRKNSVLILDSFVNVRRCTYS